jgi:serine protease Do
MTNHQPYESKDQKFRSMQMKSNSMPKISPLKAVAVAILLASGGTAALLAQSKESAQYPARVPAETLRHAQALSEAFKEVSRSVSPSVVNIRSTQQRQPRVQEQGDPRQQPESPFDDELFRRFFGDEFREFRFGPQMPSQPMPRVGEGTGVVIREDGHIVTNNHVVQDATQIRVTLNDERQYDGRVIGTDPESDLAVIKIDATDLTPATLGDSETLEVGEWVLAIGSPLGLQRTVTAGIISAKGRGTMGLADIGDFIQTDAAINPGNSGGPLVNLYGQVVGINTAISTRTGGYMGVGFAIPSNIVNPVVNSIIDTGKVERGWLGVSIQPLNDELAQSFGFNGQGVLIGDVLHNTPANEAGLKAGDIVNSINGRRVTNPSQLLNAIAEMQPGAEAKLQIFRDGQTKQYTVTLGDRAQQQLTQRSGSRSEPRQSQEMTERLGMTIGQLTPELSRQLGATNQRGVVVMQVEPGSSAANAGLAEGDIITRVGDHDVQTQQDFAEALEDADLSKGVRLQIFSQGSSRFLILKNSN